MCIVIDTCCLSMVFDGGNKRHADFEPIRTWVTSGKGRMIYGGTKYMTELQEAQKFLGIILELDKARRAIRLPDARVDQVAGEFKALADAPGFNDEHIAALAVVSRCHVVCTRDGEAKKHLMRASLFAHYKMKRPRIYSSKRNKDLCSDKYLVVACRQQ